MIKYLELKLAGIIGYILVNGAAVNYALYCMNQKSNVWLTMGIVIFLFIALFNLYILRRTINKLETKETNE